MTIFTSNILFLLFEFHMGQGDALRLEGAGANGAEVGRVLARWYLPQRTIFTSSNYYTQPS